MDGSSTKKIKAQESKLAQQEEGVTNGLATHKTSSPSASSIGLTSKTSKRPRVYNSPSNNRQTSAGGGCSSFSQSCASDGSSCDDKDSKSGNCSIVNDGIPPTTATVKQENSVLSTSKCSSKVDHVARMNMSSKCNCDNS